MKHFIFFSISVFLLICLVPGQLTAGQMTQKRDTKGKIGIQKNLSDSALLTLVQRQTFRYFWDFAHPVSGMARERSNPAYGYGDEVVTAGGTGFGVMAIIVAVERGWITRDSAARHLLKMVAFLSKADSYHGAFPHWLNGATGKTIPFSRKDDGADLDCFTSCSV